MKSILALIILVSTVMATADGPDCWDVAHVDSTDVLNVRTEPNHKSAIVGTLSFDATGLKNLETTGGLTFEEFTTLTECEQDSIRKVRPRWQKISYDTLVGWVHGRYVVEGRCE